MNAFTIKDLENLSGIKAHTLRIWEQRYSFLHPQRTNTNIRYYTNDELKTILNISLLNKYGYKISHINRMTPEEMNEKIIALALSQAQQDRMINELIRYMIDLNMDEFEDVIQNLIKVKGIEKTITWLIFPFLERIGILWLTSHINPAQEHLVSNIIRQKLIVGIENCVSAVTSEKSVLLFLPEGEHHEIGLLFMYYLLKSRGVKVLYIGTNVPLKDVEYVARLKQPHYLYTHLTSVTNSFLLERFIANISLRVPALPLVISGYVTRGYKKKLPQQVILKTSFPEVLNFVATL